MKIAIVGAAGGIGTKLVELALGRGHEVTALVRREGSLALAHPRLRVITGSATDPDAAARAVAGQDAVLTSLGNLDRASTVRSEGTRTVLAAMQRAGARRFACVSAIGVGDSREQMRASNFVFGRIILPLLLSRPFADMDAMERAVRESDTEWTIVRPTGLTNGPLTGAVRVAPLSEKVGAKISRADVAHFMLEQLADGSPYLHRAPSIYTH